MSKYIKRSKGYKHKKINISKYAKVFAIVILIFLALFYYLKKQLEVIKCQYKIKEYYDKITYIQMQNKTIAYEIEKMKSFERLYDYAKKNNFVEPKRKDISILEY